MRDAADRAENRKDRTSAVSYGALAHAAVEEAATRPYFGKSEEPGMLTRVRGRRHSRAMQELIAERSRTLDRRRVSLAPEGAEDDDAR